MGFGLKTPVVMSFLNKNDWEQLRNFFVDTILNPIDFKNLSGFLFFSLPKKTVNILFYKQ